MKIFVTSPENICNGLIVSVESVLLTAPCFIFFIFYLNHLNGIYSDLDLIIINILLQTGVQHSYTTSHQHLTSNRFLISLTGMPLMFLGFGKDVMRKIRISV